MIPSVTASMRILQLAAVAIVTVSAFAQAPPKYDRATETTLKGTVGELRLVPPSGPKPIAYLVTITGPDKDKDTVQIFLCPKSFLDDMGIAFKADEAIQITGSSSPLDWRAFCHCRASWWNGSTSRDSPLRCCWR